MEAKRKENGGSSVARERQGVGTVPSSPRSRDYRESHDGLSVRLLTSRTEEHVIAELEREKNEEMEWEKDEAEDAEKERAFLRLMARMGDVEVPETVRTCEEEEEGKGLGSIRKLKALDDATALRVAQNLACHRKKIEEDAGGYAYALLEDLVAVLTNPRGSPSRYMDAAVRCANAIRCILDKKEEELKGHRLKDRKKRKHVGIQCKSVLEKWDVWTLVAMDRGKKDMNKKGNSVENGVGKEGEGNIGSLERKLEEVTRRLKCLEDRERINKDKSEEGKTI